MCNDHASSYSSHEAKLIGPYEKIKANVKREDYRFTAPLQIYIGKSLIGYYDFKIYLTFFHLYVRVNIHYKKTRSF